MVAGKERCWRADQELGDGPGLGDPTTSEMGGLAGPGPPKRRGGAGQPIPRPMVRPTASPRPMATAPGRHLPARPADRLQGRVNFPYARAYVKSYLSSGKVARARGYRLS